MPTQDNCPSTHPCDDCPGRFVCRCLQVTEDILREALSVLDIKTVNELRQHTKAGDGCTACHAQLHQFLEIHARRDASSLVGDVVQ